RRPHVSCGVMCLGLPKLTFSAMLSLPDDLDDVWSGLRSRDTATRRGAVQSLLFQSPERLLPEGDRVFSVLLHALADGDPQVRWCSAHVLADLAWRMPQEWTIDSKGMLKAIEAAHDANPDIRCCIAVILSKHQSSAARTALQALASDSSETVRNAALRLLKGETADGT